MCPSRVIMINVVSVLHTASVATCLVGEPELIIHSGEIAVVCSSRPEAIAIAVAIGAARSHE